MGLVATDTTAVAASDKVNAACEKVEITTNATAAIKSAFTKAEATVTIAANPAPFTDKASTADITSSLLTFDGFADGTNVMTGWTTDDSIELVVTVTFEGNATTTFTATLTE